MYRTAIRLTLRGLRVLPRQSRSRFAVVAPQRLSQPHKLPASLQFRSIVTDRKPHASPAFSRDIPPPEPGTPEYVKYMAWKLTGREHDPSFKMFRTYTEDIKQGPLAVAKAFSGKLASVLFCRVMRTSEMYTKATARETNPELIELMGLDPLKSDLALGPVSLANQAFHHKEPIGEEFIEKIAELDTMIRTREGCEKLKDVSGREKTLANSKITESILRAVLNREKWVDKPRLKGEVMPGGPFEAILKYFGQPITAEIVDEIEAVEPRMPDGLLSPLGPTRSFLWKWLDSLGIRENTDKAMETDAAKMLLPEDVTEALVEEMIQSEALLKRYKKDESPGLIPEGPAMYAQAMVGRPLNKEFMKTMRHLQTTYLGGTSNEGHLVNIQGTPAYILESRRSNRGYLLRLIRAKPGEMHTSALFESGGNIPVEREEQSSEPVSNQDWHKAPRLPELMPPMEVVNAYMYNIVKRWEDSYRWANKEELAREASRQQSSPLQVVKENLGNPIDRPLYEKILDAEVGLTAATNRKASFNGPANIIRKLTSVIKPPWVITLEEELKEKSQDHTQKALKFEQEEHIYKLLNKEKRVAENLERNIRSQEKNKARLKALAEQAGDYRSVDALMSLPVAEMESDEKITDDMREVIRKLFGMRQNIMGGKIRLQNLKLGIKGIEGRIGMLSQRYEKQQHRARTKKTKEDAVEGQEQEPVSYDEANAATKILS